MGKKVEFEKVSYEQFKKDYLNVFYKEYTDKDINNHFIDNLIRDVYDAIKLPKRGTSKSAGYDFFLPFNVELLQGRDMIIPTGIKCHMLDNMVLMMFPRSGLGTIFRFVPMNLVGIVDSDYINAENEGHIFMKMINDGDKVLSLKTGNAFCQGIITRYFTTDGDYTTKERCGGFGSTG